eukprot:scaffold3372_cov107-Isochrysis_galbana.AAC.4
MGGREGASAVGVTGGRVARWGEPSDATTGQAQVCGGSQEAGRPQALGREGGGQEGNHTATHVKRDTLGQAAMR